MAEDNDGKPPEDDSGKSPTGEKDAEAKESDSKQDETVEGKKPEDQASSKEADSDEKPKASDDEPKPSASEDKPKPSDDKPKPSDDKPKPSASEDKPKPSDDKPKPSDKPEPSDVKPEPSDKPKPSDDKPKPSDDKPSDKPAVEAGTDETKDDEDDEASATKDDEDDAPSEKKVAKAEVDPPDETDDGKKEPPKPPERKAQAWGRPLARLDQAWTTWEVWLCVIAVLLEVFVLTMWVGLKGLSTEIDGSSKAGIVFRAIIGAVVLGVIANQILKRKSEMLGRVGALVGMLLGIFLAKSWGNFAIDWSGNLLNWYQQASFLTLWGGLRGVGTRLTLLLALLGGSLATAAGKHITIDLVTRYMKPRFRLPVVVTGWIASSMICGTAAWGFFDHIAIDDFGAKAEMRGGEKLSHVASGIGENFFIARKQIALDFKSFPHVLKGERYSEWMSAAEWNAWVDSAGFVERYGKEKAELLKVGEDVNRAPIVLIPEKGEPRGELAKAGNLVFPIGLFIIALRFILLALLALSGHKNIDPEAAHEMGIGGLKKTDDEPEGSEAR